MSKESLMNQEDQANTVHMTHSRANVLLSMTVATTMERKNK